MAIGFFASLMGSSEYTFYHTASLALTFTRLVPIERAQDSAKAGSGLVYLSPTDPCVLLGVDTRFSTELGPRPKIMLPKSTGNVVAEVLEVVSDTMIKLKKEFAGDHGKATSRVRQKCDEAISEGKKGLSYKILPHINQENMYKYVYQRLKEGGCIGIFPEGVIHRFIPNLQALTEL
jgi:glycerol-3-phosphate O-acyltransferase/dihydroxyacetone phosphate acyltransferase